jgi:CheY-like chemotaxis protein
VGGTIKAESEPEAGTTMRVELDAGEPPEDQAAAPSAAPAAADAPPRERGTIVYIEDNLSNLKLVEQALERLPDVRLIPAMQGKLGIDLARQRRADLILLDLHLPDVHGREVLEQLKADPATSAIPVVVISADATHTQIERLRTAGAGQMPEFAATNANLVNWSALLRTARWPARRRRRARVGRESGVALADRDTCAHGRDLGSERLKRPGRRGMSAV